MKVLTVGKLCLKETRGISADDASEQNYPVVIWFYIASEELIYAVIKMLSVTRWFFLFSLDVTDSHFLAPVWV